MPCSMQRGYSPPRFDVTVRLAEKVKIQKIDGWRSRKNKSCIRDRGRLVDQRTAVACQSTFRERRARLSLGRGGREVSLRRSLFPLQITLTTGTVMAAATRMYRFLLYPGFSPDPNIRTAWPFAGWKRRHCRDRDHADGQAENQRSVRHFSL